MEVVVVVVESVVVGGNVVVIVVDAITVLEVSAASLESAPHAAATRIKTTATPR